ncbi:MAG: hypothetical protein ABI548_15790 [Polyangiaceae bacterium]
MRERHCLRGLRGLRDEQLLSALSGLVKTGNALNADVLAHLAELDERRLYLELGFSSLFAYCLESLGMDESSAGRRITAARVCRKYPQVFARVASGALGLSVLCALNPYLNQENAAELFGACSSKSRRQVEEILAARFPRPDVRDLIRRVPDKPAIRPSAARVASPEPSSPSALPSVPASEPSEPSEPSERAAINAPSPRGFQRGEARRIEPLSVDRYGFHFTGNANLKAKVEHARALLSHELPSGELAALFERALDALITDREKRRFAVGRKPRRAPPASDSPSVARDSRSPGECCVEPSVDAPSVDAPSVDAQRVAQSSAKRSRHIPAAISRLVYARDQGRCSFVAEDGRRCNGRVFLEIDHATPHAVGGEPCLANLRLRCRAHNQWHAFRFFGRRHVEAALARARMKPERVGSDQARVFARGGAPDV